MDKSSETPQEIENSITINDLVLLRNIVSVASRRGAFSAEEFSDIGAVYNKIDTFLKANLKKPESEEASKEEETSGEVENKIEI